MKSQIKPGALKSHEVPVMRKVMGFGCAEHTVMWRMSLSESLCDICPP